MPCDKTTVADIILDGSGNPVSGTIYIKPSQTFIPCPGGSPVYPTIIEVAIDRLGVFTVDLYPNDTTTSTGTFYSVTYSLTNGQQIDPEIWLVPTAPDPSNLAAVRSIIIPAGATSIALSWLSQSGATLNQVIQWNGSSWAPATLTTSALPAGSQNQLLHIKPNTAGGSSGTNVYEWSSRQPYYAPDYTFTLTPGGSCTGGVSKTITFSSSMPCPLGVNGSNANHYVYLTGGTGASEAVLITGGTAVAGGTSGTLIFTPANSHSGAWTITSATAGIQEAMWATGGVGRVLMAAGVIQLYAPTTTPLNYVISLRGQGIGVTDLYCNGTTGNWIRFYSASYGSGSVYVDLGDFTIRNATATSHVSGSAIYVEYRFYGCVSNIEIENAYIGILAVTCENINFDNIIGGCVHYGMQITALGIAYPTVPQSAIQANAVRFSMTGATGAAFLIEGPTSSIVLNNCGGGHVSAASGNITLRILQALAYGTNGEIVVNGGIFDASGIGISIEGDNTNYVGGWVLLNGVEANGAEYGLSIANKIENISINGGFYKAGGYGGAAQQGIILSTCRNISIAGGTKVDATGAQGVTIQGTNSNLKLDAVIVGRNGNTPTGNSIGITGTFTNLAISNCDLAATPGAISNGGTGVLNLSNNLGVDNAANATITIASAGTFALGIYKSVIISGTTGVTTVTSPLAAGSWYLLRAKDGAVVFTAGTGIGNTFTLAQNVPMLCYWDGTSLWG